MYVLVGKMTSQKKKDPVDSRKIGSSRRDPLFNPQTPDEIFAFSSTRSPTSQHASRQIPNFWDTYSKLDEIKDSPSEEDIEQLVLPALKDDNLHTRDEALDILFEQNNEGQYDSIIKEVAQSNTEHNIREKASKYLSKQSDK